MIGRDLLKTCWENVRNCWDIVEHRWESVGNCYIKLLLWKRLGMLWIVFGNVGNYVGNDWKTLFCFDQLGKCSKVGEYYVYETI